MTTLCPVCNNTVDPDAAVCPQCGFKLLGATQRFEPVALEDAPPSVDAAPQARAVLHVVRGPSSGVTFQLGDAPLSIGRSPQCDVFLNDMTVSRSHATVEPDEGGYVIRDDNSFNGVWVNNDSVESRKLASGDIVQIGAFCLVYKEE
ncbi:FHA domain-containing protein [Gordonibacter sp. An230]|uniref:FHA domain-containing protein n=1 Tax=Gordonibacter sp. An230 TaxID=1965592 RepID=UPI000B3A7417|nr:FHA domain-containing protein [Gordonibacter sp. An230]OUO91467.1 FHA domain-containing protein [Gordonibacter sp. An230]